MSSGKLKFYVASKTKHAKRWRAARAIGHNIISTWIDEAGEGETADYSELSERCIREIAQCDAVILFCKPGEHLKGALVEVGAAMALGKEIRCVGECESLSRVFCKHPLWKAFSSIHEAATAQ